MNSGRWSGGECPPVAIEAELAHTGAKEAEANELGALRTPYAPCIHVLADRGAVRALRCIYALVEDNLLDDAAGGRCWVATPQQESPAQKQHAEGFDSVRHTQKSTAYG